MANALTGSLQAAAQYNYAQSFTGLADSSNSNQIQKLLSYSNGTGTGSADKVYVAQRTLAANTSETLNFAANTLLDPLNLPIIMARVKGVFCRLLTSSDTGGTNCNTITIAGLNGTAGFIDGTTPKRRIFNGGYENFGVNNATGVTSGLALNITNEDPSNAAGYIIVVFGASA